LELPLPRDLTAAAPRPGRKSGRTKVPAVSQKQRAFLFATKGAAWAKRHHFDNKGKLPTYVPGSVAKKKRRAARRALSRRGT